jgi:glyoxylase-like metal-dependent hydrolase (beta-lactamase superfamily II)
MIVRHRGKSIFARQPSGGAEETAAWRAVLVCPTASVGTASHRLQPEGLFPQEIAPGIYRCGYNAASSYGAHAYFVRRSDGGVSGNVLIDSPRAVAKLVHRLEELGGIRHILLTHRDDVAEADRYAAHFGARVWIHAHDASAAPYATDRITGETATEIGPGLLAIPVPGHTRGSVVYLFEDRYLFTGDSLAWSSKRGDLIAFREQTWYTWAEQRRSLERLVDYDFEWILPGHGEGSRLPAGEMRARLKSLVARM